MNQNQGGKGEGKEGRDLDEVVKISQECQSGNEDNIRLRGHLKEDAANPISRSKPSATNQSRTIARSDHESGTKQLSHKTTTEHKLWCHTLPNPDDNSFIDSKSRNAQKTALACTQINLRVCPLPKPIKSCKISQSSPKAAGTISQEMQQSKSVTGKIEISVVVVGINSTKKPGAYKESLQIRLELEARQVSSPGSCKVRRTLIPCRSAEAADATDKGQGGASPCPALPWSGKPRSGFLLPATVSPNIDFFANPRGTARSIRDPRIGRQGGMKSISFIPASSPNPGRCYNRSTAQALLPRWRIPQKAANLPSQSKHRQGINGPKGNNREDPPYKSWHARYKPGQESRHARTVARKPAFESIHKPHCERGASARHKTTQFTTANIFHYFDAYTKIGSSRYTLDKPIKPETHLSKYPKNKRKPEGR